MTAKDGNRNDYEKIAEFLGEVRKLETTYRYTPKPDQSFENDAEHSWAVALACMLITNRVKKELNVEVDELKVLKMALIHDLGEVIIGDYKTWDDENRKNKEKKELTSLKALDKRQVYRHKFSQVLLNIYQVFRGLAVKKEFLDS
jgi:5'-deoxynucleotidase YfbR-like HD superfamily hydrolase